MGYAPPGTSPLETIAMAQEALSVQAVCEGRFSLGIGVSHHWVIGDMLGLPYERPAREMRHYLEVLNAALRGPGDVDVENDGYRVHSPMDVTDWAPNPVLLAALAPVMLRLAGEHAAGTILWLADERAVGEHVVPRIHVVADAGDDAREGGARLGERMPRIGVAPGPAEDHRSHLASSALASIVTPGHRRPGRAGAARATGRRDHPRHPSAAEVGLAPAERRRSHP